MREFVPRARCLVAASTFIVGACIAGRDANAQAAPRLDLGAAIEVGGEAERYLRILQLTRTVPLVPWTVLPFAATPESILVPAGEHPWSARFAAPDSLPAIRWLRPTALTTLNSTFPYQDASGPMWDGRGVNLAVQAGFAIRRGRVRLQVAPIAFIAQNADFPIAPNGAFGLQRFGDARFPYGIDHPQRFGESAYGRLDAGTSSIALDAGGATMGISSAPQRWGPAREYPLLLGPGAGGFPHAFVGTATPVDLWLVRLQARLIAGYLAQSEFSPSSGPTQRTASAAVLTLSPRGADGLEIGFARFFESTGPFTLHRILRPISLHGLVGGIGDPLTGRDNIPNENQMASAFFRWAHPGAGFELYGEWYREDYPGDLRKLLLKPDDLSVFALGFQHAFVRSPSRRRVARFEIVDGELSHQERAQRGFDAPLTPYVHGEVLQGHTLRGQLLGSPEAFGGSGLRAAVDDYTPSGRLTVGVERSLRFDWLPGLAASPTPVHPDVLYAARVEILRFAGRRDYTLVLVPAVNFNRNLEAGTERINLHASLRVRGW
jgi:hypothetical protein